MLTKLSPRQETILKRLAKGQSNKEIAYELNISPETVRGHCDALKDKLRAQNPAHAVHTAYCTGLLTP